METKDIRQLRNLAEFEEAIEDGFEVPIFTYLKIQSRKRFVDKIPRIDILYGPQIPYSLDRLNEIIMATERTTIEGIIEKSTKFWDDLKSNYNQKNDGNNDVCHKATDIED
ncbi:MAG: hypothetical protein MUF12_00540 [Sediminibacterium sp.]|jgi:hypothetical protein|nr:hypothetical protein [Sediminibacterium sp.]